MIITFHLYPPLPSSVPREHHIKSSTVISVSPSIKIHVLATILSTVFRGVRSCHLVTLGGSIEYRVSCVVVTYYT